MESEAPDEDYLYLYSREDRFADPSLDDGRKYIKQASVEKGCEHWRVNLGPAGTGSAGYELFVVVMDEAAKQHYVDGAPGDIWAMKDLNLVGNARWTFKIYLPGQ
ncbi:hypothetical protein I6A84_13800 [Frankia sp. CNm7]|uniref:Uncharacterized protein n=1 Tax=Frankia nepalensis TaxID=1836974 RepID=A0A937UR17_9ACTN|nr:hypothetical protein [Frankia nepalensis]MBL7497838.1 hypothetical protein [Frankia nepalensis]MBL7509661.1 hypothetical protein [Frankia nepalensis]MBL7519152.1 hypothetical protein [Frankia nepalensis]MBL7630842.1 hypothetical protein [Frankia nepalensis]